MDQPTQTLTTLVRCLPMPVLLIELAADGDDDMRLVAASEAARGWACALLERDDTARWVRCCANGPVGSSIPGVIGAREGCGTRVAERLVVLRFDDERVTEAQRRCLEADLRKDQFLAMLGHELRNPLAPILTALELMRLKGARGLERECAMIERQIEHVV